MTEHGNHEQSDFFALTVMTILSMRGPTNTLLATGGATVGLRLALPLALSEAMGYGIAILAIGLVLKPALEQWLGLAHVLRLIVGGYLFYVAWKLLRDGRINLVAQTGKTTITVPRVFIATLLNPKAMVFAIRVVPFGTPHVALYMLGFITILVPLSVGWIAAGAALGKMAVSAGYERLISRVGAGAISVFGVLLTLSALV